MWAALRAGQEGGQILKSEMITRDVRRRYYVDLKENRRGRFVRVSQVSTATNQREQIAVPAPDGIAQLHTAVDELLRSVGATQRAPLPLHLNSTQLDTTTKTTRHSPLHILLLCNGRWLSRSDRKPESSVCPVLVNRDFS